MSRIVKSGGTQNTRAAFSPGGDGSAPLPGLTKTKSTAAVVRNKTRGFLITPPWRETRPRQPLHTRFTAPALLIQYKGMSTNLPKSRNRNLPPAPEQPAEVRRRPVMTPVQQAPDVPETGRGILRPLLAMLVIGGLLTAGIFFYIRGAESDNQKRENATNYLTGIGREIWTLKGAAMGLSTESEELKKDLEDMPRIFMKAAESGPPGTIRVIEGDPPPGHNNATHQIHYVFKNEVKLVVCILYAPDEGKLLFLGVHHRFDIPDRKSLKPADKPAPAVPLTPGSLPETAPAPAPAMVPPAPLPPPAADTPPSPAPAEKVSEPPANPR